MPTKEQYARLSRTQKHELRKKDRDRRLEHYRRYGKKREDNLGHRVWKSADELILMREICRRDFWSFFLYGFGAYSNPKGVKWIEESVHKPLADWFQRHVMEWMAWRRDGIVRQKHLAVVVHREVGKTTLISQAGQAWLHLIDPEISTYTGSEKVELATRILGPIKAVMDGSDQYSLWTKLFGNWSTGARTWKTGEVVHAARRNTARKDPSMGTFGVETSITGAHPDAIFRDDPTSYERLKSDSDWMGAVNDQTTSLVPVLQGDGLFVDVGTRYGANDHLGTSFESPEIGGDGIASVEGMQSDAYQPHAGGMWHLFFMAGRDKEGRPTTPKVWPEARLSAYQRRNALRYAAQVLNDPSVSELNPITKEQLNQCKIPAKEVPWGALRFALLCDLALWDGKKRINKDETAYCVAGYPRNGSGDVYYIEGDGSMYWRDEDFANKLITLIQRYRAQGRQIFAITNDLAMAGMKGIWKSALRGWFSAAGERMPQYFEFNRGGQKKIERISATVNFWLNGNVRLVEGAPGLEPLLDQMSRLGEMQIASSRGRQSKLKDDRIDCFADAFQPDLYQPMRMQASQSAPWEKGAQMIETEGLDRRLFEQDRQDWGGRPPLR